MATVAPAEEFRGTDSEVEGSLFTPDGFIRTPKPAGSQAQRKAPGGPRMRAPGAGKKPITQGWTDVDYSRYHEWRRELLALVDGLPYGTKSRIAFDTRTALTTVVGSLSGKMISFSQLRKVRSWLIEHLPPGTNVPDYGTGGAPKQLELPGWQS